jgi:arginyl-tRNA synthetase
MKDHIATLLTRALDIVRRDDDWPDELSADVEVENARDKAHGDFASNIALKLAKRAGYQPQELAERLRAALPEDDAIARVDIAGPGFINFFLARDWIARQARAAVDDARLGVVSAPAPDQVVVDYSSPNLAKEMHVGHLRSTIIGDAVVRTLEFLGHTVIRQNHVGDWGTQFGILLAYLEEEQTTDSEHELASELSDLEAFYQAAKARFDDDDSFAERARELVVSLQSGDAYCLQLWRRFNRISLNHCLDVYERLGISLTRDDVRGESAYNDELPDVVEALDRAGLITLSEGAACVFLEEFRTRADEPLPVIVRKADGGYLYATTDLAALRYRQRQLRADRILYFVDQRQSLHFEQVFRVARLAGFVDDTTELAHMGFGTMNGPDGRPFKTRSGGTVKLTDLLDEAEERAWQLVQSKNPELADAELRRIARVVGTGAIKYADLSKHRTSDSIFDFDQMLSFEGNTAPYLLYAYTRVASIFRRAGLDANDIDGDIHLETEAETELAGRLIQFSAVLEQVGERGLPHLLCNYLFDIAGLFSSFYEQCPVLNAESEYHRQSRLQLARLTAGVLQKGLELLGIDTLERM